MRRTKRLFVTGTDTSVGKTCVGTALVAAWCHRGHRVAVMKPVETGCVIAADSRIAEDADRLIAAAGRPLDPALVCPYRYEVPASPQTAALLRAEAPPALDRIALAADQLAADADVLVAEGAGGLLVPLAPGLLMVDLAARLQAPVLIVARTALGSINHTLLTIEAAIRREVRVLGVVFNQTQPPTGPEEPWVAERVREHTDVRVFGTLPYLSGPSSPTLAQLAELAEQHLDLQGLWEAL